MKKVKRKQRNFPSTTTEDGEQKVPGERGKTGIEVQRTGFTGWGS